MSITIKNVIPKSIAAKSGLKYGDVINKINGKEVNDYLDYMYLSANGPVFCNESMPLQTYSCDSLWDVVKYL